MTERGPEIDQSEEGEVKKPAPKFECEDFRGAEYFDLKKYAKKVEIGDEEWINGGEIVLYIDRIIYKSEKDPEKFFVKGDIEEDSRGSHYYVFELSKNQAIQLAKSGLNREQRILTHVIRDLKDWEKASEF